MTEATHETGQQEGLVSHASAKVDHATSAAQEKAADLREKGAARVRDQFDQRSTQAGSEMRSLADALHRSGQQLGDESNSNTSQLTTQAADRIERLGSYLEEKRGDELMRDIETFARRRPWMLAGIGLLAGVVAARFTKASSERRYAVHRQTGGWPTPPEGSPPGLPSGSSSVGREPPPLGAEEAGPADAPLTRDPNGGE
jgi:ElaB/YqjD/DUF883 family membrane-anchored ribosome-binding protein